MVLSAVGELVQEKGQTETGHIMDESVVRSVPAQLVICDDQEQLMHCYAPNAPKLDKESINVNLLSGLYNEIVDLRKGTVVPHGAQSNGSWQVHLHTARAIYMIIR
jgi:hypothetical protein